MDIVDEDGWWLSIIGDGGCSEGFNFKRPQILFWILANVIHQRQTRQQQDLRFQFHGAEGCDVDSNGIDAAVQGCEGAWKVKTHQ